MSRKQVWKEVWMVVDDSHVTILKKKRSERDDDDSIPVHYSFALQDVTTSRLSQFQYGFRLVCGKDTVDLMVPAEELADKWLSCITWNQLVLCRHAQQNAKQR